MRTAAACLCARGRQRHTTVWPFAERRSTPELRSWLDNRVDFLFVDKRPYVRFHAAQSMIAFGGLHILKAIVGMMLGVGWWFGGMRHMAAVPLAWPIMGLISFVSFVLWIILMVKAYQGQKFKLPLAGDLAEHLAGQ